MLDLRLWLEALVEPVALLTWGLLLLNAMLWRRPASARTRLVAVLLLGLDLLVSLPLVVNPAMGLMQQAAHRESPCAPPPPDSVLIVLTGGMIRQPRAADDFGALSGDSLRRILGAASLAAVTPRSKLVITGGGGTRYPEAEIMGRLAQAMGIPPSRIELELHSHTTMDNARDTGGLPAGDTAAPRYLVTSAYHIPRAYRAFGDAGQQVCAWPVGFYDTRVWFPDAITPQIGALAEASLLVHEWLGMVYYTLRQPM